MKQDNLPFTAAWQLKSGPSGFVGWWQQTLVLHRDCPRWHQCFLRAAVAGGTNSGSWHVSFSRHREGSPIESQAGQQKQGWGVQQSRVTAYREFTSMWAELMHQNKLVPWP